MIFLLKFFVKKRLEGSIKDLKLKMSEYHNMGNESRAEQCFQEIQKLLEELKKYE